MAIDPKSKWFSRRRFLLFGLALGGAKAADAKKPITETAIDEVETVKLLSPDGRLVEVDRKVYESASKRHQVSNREILQWRHQHQPKEK